MPRNFSLGRIGFAPESQSLRRPLSKAARRRVSGTARILVRDRSWYDRVRPPLSSDGVLPFVRYVVRGKGKVEVGVLACAMCHTRVSQWIRSEGGPGNFPFDEALAEILRRKRNRLRRTVVTGIVVLETVGTAGSLLKIEAPGREGPGRVPRRPSSGRGS